MSICKIFDRYLIELNAQSLDNDETDCSILMRS
jgi:hypothetical protein